MFGRVLVCYACCENRHLHAVGPGQGAVAVHALPVSLIKTEVVLDENGVGV